MKLSEISNLVGGMLKGEGEIDITGIAPLESANHGEISFLANPRYHHLIADTDASALLLPEGSWQVQIPYIVCKNPYLAFATLMQRFYANRPQHGFSGVHAQAVVAEDAKLGEGVVIGPYAYIDSGVAIGDNTTVYPGCFIGQDCQIGRGVVLYPHVTLRESTEIGDRVIIHPGAVIGGDGFGFAEDQGQFQKIPQIGRVVIEEDVEIGANTCIDRATLGETRIHRGAKLDNLIQIAHNVEIGEGSAVAAQTGISGSSRIGSHVKLGGQVGLAGHITLGDYVICGAQAGVTKSHPDQTFLSGYPARPHKDQLKIEAALSRAPDLLKRVAKLEKRLKDLESDSDS